MNEDRWTFMPDMNFDGVVTISDVGLWIEWLFFMPGDILIEGMLLLTPGLAVFLEFTIADFGGWGSGVFSAVAWFMVLGTIFRMGLLFCGIEEPK